jgi:hypothetical protein
MMTSPPACLFAAVECFTKLALPGCVIDHKRDKPIYALVKIDGWPASVHYEFRFSARSGLFVELHMEHRDYAYLGQTLSALAAAIPSLAGNPVHYSGGYLKPASNQKRWPSLSIALGQNAERTRAADVMRHLIEATRPQVTKALGNWRHR